MRVSTLTRSSNRCQPLPQSHPDRRPPLGLRANREQRLGGLVVVIIGALLPVSVYATRDFAKPAEEVFGWAGLVLAVAVGVAIVGVAVGSAALVGKYRGPTASMVYALVVGLLSLIVISLLIAARLIVDGLNQMMVNIAGPDATRIPIASSPAWFGWLAIWGANLAACVVAFLLLRYRRPVPG